jgi:hypothetical protein
MGEVCSMYEVHRAFVGKPEGMWPLPIDRSLILQWVLKK